MRRRIALSLMISLLLIIGAVWFRIAHTVQTGAAATLAVVPNTTTAVSDADEAKLEAIYNGTADIATPATTTDENLTDTDLISRQMLSDYVSMSANGQTTQTNLDALGDQYATNIISTNKAESILATDLTVVNNSKQSLQTYADTFATIYKKYGALEAAASQGITSSATSVTADSDDFNGSIAKFSQTLGDLYQKEADELKTIPVPKILITDHTSIVNRYLRDAWDMQAIANLETNPTDASAALASQNSAGDDEQNILSNIDKILTANAIIVSNS